VHADFQTRTPLRMWLGDVSTSKAEALNTGSYGVFPIFDLEVMAENVNNLKLFKNKMNSISVANMFKANLGPWLFL